MMREGTFAFLNVKIKRFYVKLAPLYKHLVKDKKCEIIGLGL